MKLNRVSLQGFLAHYGQEIDGAIAPIDLDFRESNLWLMHGANGSGKSSVFDAITFALFDRARGGQLAKLVNDRSTAASVEVELEAGGARYLIKRRLKLKKNRDGHSSSLAQIFKWSESENRWIEEEGVGKIKDWAERTLKVSYENFVSSVILEQGRADQFLRASPKDRRKQLMQLLDLSVYEKISETANARRNQSRAELKGKENQLGLYAPVTPEDVASANQFATDAQTQWSESNTALNRAQKAHDDAQRAAELDAQIAEKTAQQNADADILVDAEIIENAVVERDELNAILPSLRSIGAARRASINAENELSSARVESENARVKKHELTPVVEQTRVASEAAASALTALQLRATRAELDGARAHSDAETLAQIEELEADVAACKRAMEPHRVWLDGAETIESRRARIAELNEIARKVGPIEIAAQKLRRARKARGELENARAAALSVLRDAERELKAVANVQSESNGDKLKNERDRLAAKLEFNRDILTERDRVGHADECPTCGSTLDDPEARERIEQEREMLAREVAKWERRLDEIEVQLRALESECKARAQTEKLARAVFDDARRNADKTDAQLDNARHDVEEKTRELQSARDEAGASADEDLATIQEQIDALKPQTIEADWSALQRARETQMQIAATANANRAQLARLPNWDAEKRHSIGDLQRDLAGVLSKLRAELEVAQTLATQANERAQTADDDLATASNAIKIATALEAQQAAAAERTNAEWDAQLANLSLRWREHPAALEDAALNELAARYDALQSLAARVGELREARQRVSNLQSAIELLRAQIEAIAPEHRIAPAETESALERARDNLKNAEVALQTAREHAIQTASARQTFERYEAERNEAQVEFGRDQELAEALGRDGLQARIIKQAQENLRGTANGILGRLSKGQWQIDLREAGGDDKEKELEIIARDLARGGAERTFDALSGGERFRVAISLAIAIGQMAAGGAPMNTLVIDEGFGALDEENRGLMVDNLRHLSEHELKNGRIIVVSHQNDVQDFFGHRYQLSRDKMGYAQVEMTVG